jgi:plastocyanin
VRLTAVCLGLQALSAAGRPGIPGTPAPLPLGVLEGRVTLAPGSTAEPTMVENTTDPTVCGHQQSLEDVVVSPAGGLRHVIVSVDGAAAATGARSPAARPRGVGAAPGNVPPRLTIDNRRCRFEPHAAVATLGTLLETTNSDPVLHTVHLYGAVEANLALPLRGMSVTRTLDRPGLVAIKCDVHGWMQAFVRVDPHALHAVSDGAGRFRITGIPPGDHRVELWHERLGREERRVSIRSGEKTIVDVRFGTAR